MSQHAGLTADRWRSFPSDQQLLMIANEMNRIASSMAPDHGDSRIAGYERVLRLTDLTVEVCGRSSLRRELLRWRDLVAELFLAGPSPDRHREVLRALLLLSPAGAEQLRVLEGR